MFLFRKEINRERNLKDQRVIDRAFSEEQKELDLEILIVRAHLPLRGWGRRGQGPVMT